MNTVLKYLELKNFWFKKFLTTCEFFLASMKKNPDISMESLDLFEGNRNRLLTIIKRTEEKLQISLEQPEMLNFIPNSEQKTKINFHLREKDSILAQILITDKEILDLMESVRKDTDEKIKLLNKGKKALAKYKSTVKYSDGLDKQV